MEHAPLDLATLSLPLGPPLHLERPGRAVELLRPFLTPERLSRLESVLSMRTRHLTVLTDSLHDEHNIAACVRSCEAFGLQDLHVIPQEQIKRKKLSIMVSTGSHKWVSMTRHADGHAAADALEAAGYRLVVTVPPDQGASTPLDALDVTRPIALVFGNERDGVSEALHTRAAERVHIPMSGFVESLNVSVACAITLCRLRAKMDTEVGEAALLTAEERRSLLDLWVARDVPRVADVANELIRRHEALESG